ncbi:MAG TPA: hypothetical protein VF596_13360 [Pyrinomonadaceae bacterium]|jgi:hypothetical protein
MYGKISYFEDSRFDTSRSEYIQAITSLPLVKRETQRLLIKHLENLFSDSSDECIVKFWEECREAYIHKDPSLDGELGLPAEMLIKAFDGFGVRYPNEQAYLKANRAGNEFQGKYYCAFYDSESNYTIFYRNHDLLDTEIAKYFASIELD